jgi:hypothetical protein
MTVTPERSKNIGTAQRIAGVTLHKGEKNERGSMFAEVMFCHMGKWLDGVVVERQLFFLK